MNKKYFVYLILLFLFLGLIFLKTENYDIKFSQEKDQYKVIEIVDGDTISIKKNDEKIKIRMLGIDAPESSTLRFGKTECFGMESKIFLKNILKEKNISIELDQTQGEKDKYGRTLAFIFLGEKNINEEVLKNGYGFLYETKKKHKYYENFLLALNEAKKTKKGLWGKDNCQRK